MTEESAKVCPECAAKLASADEPAVVAHCAHRNVMAIARLNGDGQVTEYLMVPNITREQCHRAVHEGTADYQRERPR